MDWETPAWQTPLDRVDQVELFCLPHRDIIPDEDWPGAFGRHLGDRQLLLEPEGRQVINLFRELEPGVPARCHLPPCGIGFYEADTLLFSITLCYRCNNAYIYTTQGKVLRAFDSGGRNAVALHSILRQHLPLHE
jgi:hypothetical protein